MLCSVLAARILDVVRLDIWALLAVDVVVLALPVLPGHSNCIIIILSHYLLELTLRLTFRVIVEGMQIVRAHLLHGRWIVLELLGGRSAVRHGYVLEHLLLRDWHVPAHCTRSVLIRLHHLRGARALVANYFICMALGLIHVILRGAQLSRAVRVEKRAWLVALILLEVIH